MMHPSIQMHATVLASMQAIKITSITSRFFTVFSYWTTITARAFVDAAPPAGSTAFEVKVASAQDDPP